MKIKVKRIPGYRVLHKCGHWENHNGIQQIKFARKLTRVPCGDCFYGNLPKYATNQKEKRDE